MSQTKRTPRGTQTYTPTNEEREALTKLYLSAVEQGLTTTVAYLANEFKHHGWPLPEQAAPKPKYLSRRLLCSLCNEQPATHTLHNDAVGLDVPVCEPCGTKAVEEAERG